MHSTQVRTASPPFASSPSRRRSLPTSTPCKMHTQGCNDLIMAQTKNSEAQTSPVALTIAGLDPSGGAGVIADVRTFSAFGCFPTAAITSLTFQNTTGVAGAAHQPAEVVRAQVRPIIE